MNKRYSISFWRGYMDALIKKFGKNALVKEIGIFSSEFTPNDLERAKVRWQINKLMGKV